MRYRSKKTEETYKERRLIVARLLTERPLCEACPIFATYDGKKTFKCHESIDVHEIVSRGRGGSILDENNLITVCRFPCHSRITGDSKTAEFLGLAMPGWTTSEMVQEARQRRETFSGGVRPDASPSWRDTEYWSQKEQTPK